jgi:hypothetical protein
MSSLHRGDLVQMPVERLRMLRFHLTGGPVAQCRGSVVQNLAIERILVRVSGSSGLLVLRSFARSLFKRQPMLGGVVVVELGLRFVTQQTRKLGQRNRFF